MKNLEIGNRIVELREAFGITQAKLAKSLGMHVNAISRIERGVVRLTEKILKWYVRYIRRMKNGTCQVKGKWYWEIALMGELTEKYRKLTPAMQELIDKMIDLLNEQEEREN